MLERSTAKGLKRNKMEDERFNKRNTKETDV